MDEEDMICNKCKKRFKKKEGFCTTVSTLIKENDISNFAFPNAVSTAERTALVNIQLCSSCCVRFVAKFLIENGYENFKKLIRNLSTQSK